MAPSLLWAAPQYRAVGGNLSSGTPDGPEEAVISPAVTIQRSTYSASKLGTIAPRPSQMLSGNGNYWTRHILRVPSSAYPDRCFSYFSSDHDDTLNGSTGSGGIYLNICVADPSVPANWKLYNEAVTAGWLDDIASKPASNPIYTGAGGVGRQCETPCVRKVGSTFVMTYQLTSAPGARNQATLRATSVDGVNWTGPNVPLMQVATAEAIGDGHQGYMTWAENPFPRNRVPYNYVGYSLIGGQFRSTMGMWGWDDPVAGTPVFLGALSKWNGRFSPSNPFTQTSNWFAAAAIEIDVGSIRQTRQGYSALVEFAAQGSGSNARPGDIYEILLDGDGKTMLGKPQLVVARGTSGYDQGEVGTVGVMTFGDKRLITYDAATSANAKVSALSSTSLRSPQNTWFRSPAPHKPVDADVTVKSFNFAGASSLPVGLTEVKVGSTLPAASFSANGLSVTVDGTMATKGEYYLFEDVGFDPAVTEYVDIYIDDWITTSAAAYRVPYIGFATSKTARSAMTDAIFIGNGEGIDGTMALQAVDGGTQPIAASISDYYYGVGYGPSILGTGASKKHVGVRLFPTSGRAYILGEGGTELQEMTSSNGNLMTNFDMTQRWYPFFGFKGADTAAAVERVGKMTVKVKSRAHLAGDATLGIVGSAVTATNTATPSFASLAIDAAASDRYVAFFISGRSTAALTSLTATFTPDGGAAIPLTQLHLHQSTYDAPSASFMGLFIAAIPTGTAGTLAVAAVGTTPVRWGVKAVPMYGINPTPLKIGSISAIGNSVIMNSEVDKREGGIVATAAMFSTTSSTFHAHAAEESRVNVDSGEILYATNSTVLSVLGIKNTSASAVLEATGSAGAVAVVASWAKAA
ncbi:hypothetical protein SAMN03159496_04611 [Rhizobium sp. NFR07]|uniref:hypothetical protein n=1 Tax=Rhizobium sp. NFR07 TaxID=1566262 RepID=UPI0008EDCA81|nr:hypothetical protein [Rhizobium sp. NFR07]SFB52159.1 hypothetical protein SAMN03159496_04611 [Rhizobium sp. NFR07]